ncbi:glycolate oxidase iron-sulfur subunit [Parelusimicrobium proximum]|uniref:4Fe-4S dicluster domain-containing protein n=1 Tax=Parelusimicrobium proximum TaxID=3228953 RepID=UPI003D1862CC
MPDNFFDFSTPKVNLFKDGKEDGAIQILDTSLGEKTLYDSISQCNKCAYCSRACPTHLIELSETFSARGRNMAGRFIMEGKFNPSSAPKQLSSTMHSCLLCGSCKRECFAGVPTPEHVLAVERVYGQRKLPFLLNISTKYRIFPSIFCNFLRCLGLMWLLSLFSPTIRKMRKYFNYLFLFPFKGSQKNIKDAKFIYIPSFETQFCDPKLGRKTEELLTNEKLNFATLALPAGLADYIYGSASAARKKAAKIIDLSEGKKIVTDSLELYSFIKKYPQLLRGTPHYNKALQTAKSTFFITDVIKKVKKSTSEKTVILSKTNAFDCGENLFTQTEALLKKISAKNYMPLWKGQHYPVPSLGYPFVMPACSDQIFKTKTDFIKGTSADILILCSASQKLPLYFWCKKYYPNIRVYHIVDFLTESQI